MIQWYKEGQLMRITHVKVRKVNKEGSNLKAFAEVRLDECFVVKDIRIIQKPEKMVVAMPSKTITTFDKENEGEQIHVSKDLAHPINKETREMFNDTILGVYERATEDVYEEDIEE